MPDPLYALARTLLFSLDAERAHELTLSAARAATRIPGVLAMTRAMYAPPNDPRLTTEIAGLRFGTPVGLAAGLDKNGVAIDFWGALGFGFVEVGTVTPGSGQVGNDKPRLERHVADRAIVNRMGFNNEGAPALAGRLAGRRTGVPVGANIGKAKVTPLARAADDYAACLSVVWPCADYIAVNVSSPNTPGLRDLQNIDTLAQLLDRVGRENTRLAKKAGRPRRPVFLKIAPDLADEDLDAIAELAIDTVDGLIATNTTIRTDGLSRPPSIEGGVSGGPLEARALDVTRRLYRQVAGKLPLIGVGGITDADSAYARIRAGASLVQVYTGLVYEGPSLPGRLARGIAARLQRDGFDNVAQAVGSAADVTNSRSRGMTG